MSSIEACCLAAVAGTMLGAYAFDSVGKGFLCALGAVVAALLARRLP
jgi:hypothetical protein